MPRRENTNFTSAGAIDIRNGWHSEESTFRIEIMSKLLRVLVAVGLTMVPVLGAAQTTPEQEHHHPGPHSIAACKDKSEGVACEFDGPHRHVVGTCRKVESGVLACVHPHHHAS
jgi:hypothetical protein